MDIENEIFKKSVILYNKLETFGFKKNNKNYIYEKNILNDSFKVIIRIDKNSNIVGKIYDLSFNEEYINFRNNSYGEYVTTIRNLFIEILNNIKDKGCINKYFIYDQSNRLANLIYDKYNDIPEFLWHTNDAIFRNKKNNKWYALIMNINKNKIDNESKDIKILNIKIDNESKDIKILNIKIDNKLIKKLLNKKGFYKAYHMNKENWITILLDDTLKDIEIMNLIDTSYKKTCGI